MPGQGSFSNHKYPRIPDTTLISHPSRFRIFANGRVKREPSSRGRCCCRRCARPRQRHVRLTVASRKKPRLPPRWPPVPSQQAGCRGRSFSPAPETHECSAVPGVDVAKQRLQELAIRLLVDSCHGVGRGDCMARLPRRAASHARPVAGSITFPVRAAAVLREAFVNIQALCLSHESLWHRGGTACHAAFWSSRIITISRNS
jgi:hypothetical protein